MFREKEAEGMPKDKALWAQYIATRMAGETYPDWYRRVHLLPEALKGKNLPGPDGVGFSSQVDLEDVKLKIVQHEGKNLYDYELWPDRHRIVARRPFVEKAAEELMGETLDVEEVRSRIAQVLNARGISNPQITVNKLTGGDADEVDIDLQEDRTADIMKIHRRGGF